jgi:UDP-N-acetylglucosamine transferase subunit ALG13
MDDADVIITHAGVGSALTALRAGKRAIYVPRRKRYDEHVDDHQVAMARELDSRGLVLAREADEITLADLEEAAGWRVSANPHIPQFRLG